ncbi:bromo-adjacent homology (BAH) domain-containing protein [Striga hermonthica]|uniref:Bromo-adjacent homology (BAH) domain-containing protein n=1 Tax=Striga hermonthica TaxID=68872 RepID=A0A9N7RP35_STRHE|nr:bromo-adjacent homology (BAH) domain-containing protein [Striga hermonthica]
MNSLNQLVGCLPFDQERLKEAIAGKCNVVCISKDSRNPQPSAEELEAADYVFYRVFDVKSCTVSDHMDDKVGGLEVKYVFNKGESVRTPAVPNHNPSGREIPEVAVNGANYVKQGDNAKGTLVKKGNLPGDGPGPSGVHVNSSDIRKLKDNSIEKQSMLGEKNIGSKAGSEKDKSKDIKSPTSQVKVEERVKYARNPGDLDGTQPKKARLDGTLPSLEVKDVGCVQSLTSPGKDAVNLVTGVPSAYTNSQSELNKNLDRSGKDGNLAGKSGDLNEKLLKSAELTKDLEGDGKDAKLKKDVNASHGKPSKDSAATEMGKELGENLSARKRLLNIDVVPELVNNPNASTQIPLKQTPNGGNTPYDNDTRIAYDSSPLGGPPTKKGKFDANAKNSIDCKNKSNENMKDKASPSEAKNSPKLKDHNDMAKSKLIKGGPKENTNVEVGKPPRKSLSTPTTRNGSDGKVESRTFEVTRRPIIEKSKWMKLNWEDKMKNAHDQGRLLLLQNLDLTYTSGDVEKSRRRGDPIAKVGAPRRACPLLKGDAHALLT